MPVRLEEPAYAELLERLDVGPAEGPVPDDAWARLAHAWAHARDGQRAEAARCVRGAVADDRSGLRHYVAAMILFVAREHELSLAHFERAIECEHRLTGRALSARAQRELRLERTGDARETIRRLIDDEPARLRWRLHAMRLASQEGDFDDALAHADASLAREPEAASIHVERATILLSLGRGQEAIAAAKRGAELDGRSLVYVLETARVAFVAGEHAEARAVLVEAADRHRGDVRPSVMHAGLCLRAGDFAKARKAIESAVDQAPEHPLVERVLGAIELHDAGSSSAVSGLGDAEAWMWLSGVDDAPARPRPDPHAGDADDLVQIRTLLAKAMGLSREGAKPRRRTVATNVDDALVQRFVERGYVRVEDAFPKEVASKWVADAVSRLRDPERWVRGYDPADTARRLDDFDPDAPETWRRTRVDLFSTHAMPLSEFSPRAWDVACALVGGADRFDRAEISNHLVVNFRMDGDPEDAAPVLGGPSWHLDDPSQSERLREFRRGLILFVMLSDVAKASGAPFIAPESVRLVARELEAHPDGVDMADRGLTARLTAECTERVELTASAGDIYLVHPFMLHTGSGNPSGRIRWMANPILTLAEPLSFDRDAPSPLEQSVVAALRG